jgi:HAD superfamily phosphoserine phosphatase-like hydrolase
MAMKHYIIFDFDGTLYPIIDFDSEQLLVHTLAQEKDEEFRREAMRFIADDQAGCFSFEDFHLRYEEMIRGSTAAQVEQVARHLASLLSFEDRAALVALKEQSGADFAIFSCGTENLAESFLSHLGIRDLFESIRGKRLTFSEGEETTLTVDIHTPEAKRSALEQLRPMYRTIVAVGDGPTDIPMLEAADLGLIMNWNTGEAPYPFETHHSLPSLCNRIESYLLSAEEA